MQARVCWRCLILLGSLFALSLAAPLPKDSGDVGILVMAHGGGPEWNRAVDEAVTPLSSICPTVVAFGMAQRESLQVAVQELERKGSSRIAVIGLFVSPQSFRHQVEYFLGLRSEPPPRIIGGSSHFKMEASTQNTGRPAHHEKVPPPIEKKAVLILNRQGLYDSAGMGEILLERIRAQSVSPHKESLLILGHGTGDDAENARWLSKLDGLAGKVREWKPFRAVQVETLREDWKDKRKAAEKRIRDFVIQGNREDGRVIVVPFRLFGFGPYRDVLKGLHYVADGVGLLPHLKVTEWIKEQSADCFSRAGWPNPFALAEPHGQ